MPTDGVSSPKSGGSIHNVELPVELFQTAKRGVASERHV